MKAISKTITNITMRANSNTNTNIIMIRYMVITNSNTIVDIIMVIACIYTRSPDPLAFGTSKKGVRELGYYSAYQGVVHN